MVAGGFNETNPLEFELKYLQTWRQNMTHKSSWYRKSLSRASNYTIKYLIGVLGL